MFSGVRSGSLGSATFCQDFLSSARVKGGYVFGNLLAYGTFGTAWSTTDYREYGVSTSTTIKGVAYGLGVEYPDHAQRLAARQAVALRFRRRELHHALAVRSSLTDLDQRRAPRSEPALLKKRRR